jgi:hypothetical protein
MSEKTRQKKDGERKDKDNQAMREAERDPEEKAKRSQQRKNQSASRSLNDKTRK